MTERNDSPMKKMRFMVSLALCLALLAGVFALPALSEMTPATPTDLAGAEETEIAAGREYALHLGLAFQMTDDLLDVTGSADRLGKSTGKDQEQNKMTWVALKGVEGTAEDARREIALAKEALNAMPGDTALFADLADSLLGRAQ